MSVSKSIVLLVNIYKDLSPTFLMERGIAAPVTMAVYKMQKAQAFVEKGYSVCWYPDHEGCMAIYHPKRLRDKLPEVRAIVRFSQNPLTEGLVGGRITRLVISTVGLYPVRAARGEGAVGRDIVFCYEEGVVKTDRQRDQRLRRVIDDVLDELN